VIEGRKIFGRAARRRLKSTARDSSATQTCLKPLDVVRREESPCAQTTTLVISWKRSTRGNRAWLFRNARRGQKSTRLYSRADDDERRGRNGLASFAEDAGRVPSAVGAALHVIAEEGMSSGNGVPMSGRLVPAVNAFSSRGEQPLARPALGTNFLRDDVGR